MEKCLTSEEVQKIAKKERGAILRHQQGPAIVVAGPGSGKTTILAERFVSLCQEETPCRIVAITFTNAATDQMKEKVVQKLQGLDPGDLRISTLHSLAKGLLHKHSNKLGLPSAFRVVGQLEEELLITDVRLELKKQQVKLGNYHKRYLRRFEAAKAFVSDVDAVAVLPTEIGYASQDQFDDSYSSLLAYYRCVDWYDVVALAVKLLNENNDVRSEVAGGIDYLLVDEYQDLNRADQELVRLLATNANSLMVFGDDDQSIYQTMRHANPGGFKNFTNDYPNAVTYPLSVCWRCGSEILDKSWRLIDVGEDKMPDRIGKQKPIPNPERGKGCVEILKRMSEKKEIATILAQVRRELDGEQPPKDVLVLFHDKKLGRKYVDSMPCQEFNGKNLIGQPRSNGLAVPLLHEALCLLHNESDNLAARFLLQHAFGQHPGRIKKARYVSEKRGISLWESAIKNASDTSLSSWAKKLAQWRQTDDLDQVVTELASAMNISGDPEIQGIIEWSNEQTSLSIPKLLGWLERRFDVDEPQSEDTPEGVCMVKFMTMYGAKGIDADVVFVPALEDDFIPGQHYKPEQRRLLYVCMTRAKRRLVLSWAWSRTGSYTYRSPQRAEIDRECSCFLREIGG